MVSTKTFLFLLDDEARWSLVMKFEFMIIQIMTRLRTTINISVIWNLLEESYV